MSFVEIALTFALLVVWAVLSVKEGERKEAKTEAQKKRVKQQILNGQTLDQLYRAGFVEGAEQELGYVFTMPSKSGAKSLRDALRSKGYQSEYRPAAPGDTAYLVTGTSTPIQLTRQAVLKWTDEMCGLASRFNGEFDSWGIDAPLTQENSEQLTAITGKFEALVKEAFVGTIDFDAPITPLGSRLGGPMMTAKHEPRPTDANGKSLQQVLFVNLSELATLSVKNPYPTAGWFQVLIGIDDLFGCEFPSSQGEGFRLIYHPPNTEFSAPEPEPLREEYTPWDGEHWKHLQQNGAALTWTTENHWPGPEHYLIDPLIWGAYHEASNAMKQNVNALLSSYEDRSLGYDVVIGGHARFVQSDIRANKEDLPGIWENLIGFSSTGQNMMWGDAGEATILLPEDDLAKDYYARAKFNWDCG